MAAAFIVILAAEEEENRPRLKKPRVFRDRYYLLLFLIIELRLYGRLLVSASEAYVPHPPLNVLVVMEPHFASKVLTFNKIYLYSTLSSVLSTLRRRVLGTDTRKRIMVIMVV